MFADDLSDFIFFNDTATTEIYTLSLHDALPILHACISQCLGIVDRALTNGCETAPAHVLQCDRNQKPDDGFKRSEEHTSELQSRQYLVCRLLLEKKKQILYPIYLYITPILLFKI